jgi:hypothetical protein
MNFPRFDAALWRAQKGSTALHNPRARMLVLLERDLLRVGMPKTEVRTLLGEPDSAHGNVDVYRVGVSAHGIDRESYVIEYANERVRQMRLKRG